MSWFQRSCEFSETTYYFVLDDPQPGLFASLQAYVLNLFADPPDQP
jgi:hypothetical protein